MSEQHPDKVKELVDLWFEEAHKNNVLPLQDLGILELMQTEFKMPVPPGGQYVYYPGTSEVPERSAANTHGVSFKALAQVEFTSQTQGILFAQGSRFGGHALYVKDGKLHYVYNFLGIPPEQRLVGDAPSDGTHVVGIDFAKERRGDHGESYGSMKLYIDEDVVDEREFRTMSGHFAITGEGLCIGYDAGDKVTDDYPSPPEFAGGTLVKVIFDVADDAYVDAERHLAAAMWRD